MKLENDKLISHYKILSAIGKGGMGEVYLALDTKLKRQVAIKFLNEEFSRDAEKLRRFIQEAQATSALNHPNILTVYGTDSFEDLHYIVTEFIEGETLREAISKKETIPLNQILKIAIQVAEALSAAHNAGIAHRDIKPENIMIRDDGYVKVLDFGLAKLTEKRRAGGEDKATLLQGEIQNLTAPGVVMGTVSYMSPEQARGKETDERTDIWSVGVVLYEMIAGKLPFTGETINHTIVSILENEPKEVKNIPNALQRIIRKTLTKEKDSRYQTARDLVIDLKTLRHELKVKDELERSVMPDKNADTEKVGENETQAYTAKSIEETKAEAAEDSRNVTTSSSLEYAVTQAKSHKLFSAIAALILLGTVSAIAFFAFFAGSADNAINSIAVMPFENNSISADSEYLSDGLVESLIYRLSQIDNLKVSPTSSVFRYKGKVTDSIGAGNELGVAAVMTGRIAQRGDDLTISVELVDIRSNKTLWGERYNRKMSDLLTTQQEITGEIVQKLKLKLAGEDEKEIKKIYTADNDAYQLYLKGRFHYGKRTNADIEEGIKYFEQAIARDPGFALAYVGISESYRTMPSYGYVAPKEVRARARVAAQKALEIAPDLAEARAAVAGTAIVFDWDWQKAESEYKKAIELGPNVAEIHKTYGWTFLVTMGRFSEAVAELKRALELEPLSAVLASHLASSYMYDGQPDKALEQTAAANYLAPGHPTVAYHSCVVYNKLGMYDKAIEIAEKGLDKDPDNQDSLLNAGYAYAKSGQRRKAEEVIQRLVKISESRWVPRSYVAQIYGALGENDRAITELEKAFEDRDVDISKMNVHPYFDDLRNDPRFLEIAKRVGIPERK